MIPGRFKSSYSHSFGTRNKIVLRVLSWFLFLPFNVRHSFLGHYLESDTCIHLLDTFVRTREVDPFDDTRLRYVVRMYKYDAKRKQVVPTRAGASTTLRGAQRLARQISDQTDIPYSQDHWHLREYIMIYCYRAYVDYEKARIRSWSRKRSGG
jgi:hypothetical protein